MPNSTSGISLRVLGRMALLHTQASRPNKPKCTALSRLGKSGPLGKLLPGVHNSHAIPAVTAMATANLKVWLWLNDRIC